MARFLCKATAAILLAILVGELGPAASAEWKNISEEQSQIAVSTVELVMDRKIDQLWEDDGYKSFSHYVRLQDRAGRKFLMLIFFQAHPGSYLTNEIEVSAYVNKFGNLRNKAATFLRPFSARNKIGRIDAVVANVDNRQCLIFRQYWNISRATQHAGTDQGPRSLTNLIGGYCCAQEQFLTDTEIAIAFASYGIKG